MGRGGQAASRHVQCPSLALATWGLGLQPDDQAWLHEPQPSQAPPSSLHRAQTCSKSAFCTRLRGQAGPQFAVDPASVSVSGPHLAARLIPAAQPNVTLPLRLILQHGSIRLHLSEQGVPRFEVPGVLLPEAGDLQRVRRRGLPCSA